MKTAWKGLAVALIHVLLVASLGAKMLYDRKTRPRVWARTVTYDPDLPIRGRYLSLQVEVHAADIPVPEPSREPRAWRWWQSPPTAVNLSKEDDKLVARKIEGLSEMEAFRLDQNAVVFRRSAREASIIPVLREPVLFFIPEGLIDPTWRARGEELWVELTLPKKGPPRPIRLAVKKPDGAFTPLQIN
jgi:hypothetical protein